MIDWDAMIKPENGRKDAVNKAECREFPTMSDTNNENVGTVKDNIHEGFIDCSRHFRHFRQENEGVGVKQEKDAPIEGVASDNFSDAKTYPVNPIAICLLLTCCNKVTAGSDEIMEQIMKLQTMPQSEQIRTWAMTCQKYGIDPYRIIYPFTQSSSKGVSCQGCKHISMEKILTDKRPVFRFVCGQHHPMLEAFYVGERVLIAPESCTDYQSTAGTGAG
ncbi:hypothetical protein [Nitrosomonas ureae]|uniref:Uncharacterized protein n=1 Tax=Nitrosomonas ureae TaxID=44577 RepID=A0A1H5T0Y8_9PROT|nr:hypothetical protein [Nitrosomonas ureae]SEF56436.1 hypothetical protein SAMN05216334_103196 [Nitrosomonas ureae]